VGKLQTGSKKLQIKHRSLTGVERWTEELAFLDLPMSLFTLNLNFFDPKNSI
jgi:hypothetical protein